MAFTPSENLKKARKKIIGHLRKSSKSDGLFLKIADDCDLILYNPDSGEYFKVLKVPVKPSDTEDDNVLFYLEVDLDKPQQVEFKAKD